MKSFAKLSLGICFITLSCAHTPPLTPNPTPYEPFGSLGGYEDMQINENTFNVSFKGNGWTSQERASDFALLRSAELTLNNGFNYFIIAGTQDNTKNASISLPSRAYSTAGVYPYGNQLYGNQITTTYPGGTINISKPAITMTIMCYKEKPKMDGVIYEPKFLVKSIKDKYNLSE